MFRALCTSILWIMDSTTTLLNATVFCSPLSMRVKCSMAASTCSTILSLIHMICAAGGDTVMTSCCTCARLKRPRYYRGLFISSAARCTHGLLCMRIMYCTMHHAMACINGFNTHVHMRFMHDIYANRVQQSTHMLALLHWGLGWLDLY